jgi:hypothetical protein
MYSERKRGCVRERWSVEWGGADTVTCLKSIIHTRLRAPSPVYLESATLRRAGSINRCLRVVRPPLYQSAQSLAEHTEQAT